MPVCQQGMFLNAKTFGVNCHVHISLLYALPEICQLKWCTVYGENVEQ